MLNNIFKVRSFKAHYQLTYSFRFPRWEGDIQFYQWCERTGIVVEQSKGGSKQGNKGFLAGTCHPYVPVSNASERNRFISAQQPCTGLTVLIAQSPSMIGIPSNEGTIRSMRSIQRFGLPFHELILDIMQGNTTFPLD